MSLDQKPLRWMGASYRELTAFPPEAQRGAGFQLGLLQIGQPADDWKPMEGIGAGVCEIRLRTEVGGTVEYRVFYVAKFPEAIYVLHAFVKKTERTSPHNLQVARARYREMVRDRESMNRQKKR